MADKIVAWLMTLSAVFQTLAAVGGSPWGIAAYAWMTAVFAWLLVLRPKGRPNANLTGSQQR